MAISRGPAAAVVMAPLALSFVVPLVGPLVSIASPVLAMRLGPIVWPQKRPGALLGVIAFTAVWLPVLLRLLIPSELEVPSLILPSAHFWTAIPLCGPRDALTFVLPLLAALAVYVGGSAASVWHDRTALWPLASLAATYTYTGIVLALEATGRGGFIC